MTAAKKPHAINKKTGKAGATPGSKPKKIHKRSADGRTVVRVGKSVADVLEKPESLKEWDDEELLRGQKRAKNGKFVGQPPKIIPTEIFHELSKRKLSFAKQQMSYSLEAAVKTLTDILQDQKADPNVRLKAVGMIFDRAWGKPKETVEITGDEAPWMKTLRVSIVTDSNAEIIDAELVDDDGDELKSA